MTCITLPQGFSTPFLNMASTYMYRYALTHKHAYTRCSMQQGVIKSRTRMRPPCLALGDTSHTSHTSHRRMLGCMEEDASDRSMLAWTACLHVLPANFTARSKRRAEGCCKWEKASGSTACRGSWRPLW